MNYHHIGHLHLAVIQKEILIDKSWMLYFHFKGSTTNCLLRDKSAQCLQGSVVECLLGVTGVPKVSSPHIPVYSCKICESVQQTTGIIDQMNSNSSTTYYLITTDTSLLNQTWNRNGFPSSHVQADEPLLQNITKLPSHELPIFSLVIKINIVARRVNTNLIAFSVYSICYIANGSCLFSVDWIIITIITVFRISSSYKL